MTLCNENLIKPRLREAYGSLGIGHSVMASGFFLLETGGIGGVGPLDSNGE